RHRRQASIGSPTTPHQRPRWTTSGPCSRRYARRTGCGIAVWGRGYERVCAVMRIMGRPRALVTVLAGALLLAGCASGPSQVGAAVIFKDRSLSVNDVQGLIDKAVREQPYAQKLASEHKLDLIGREIVRQQVVHELLTAAAPQLNTAASDPLIAQALSQDPFGQPVGADVSDQASAVTAVVHSVRDHREAVTDLVQQRVLAAQTIPKLSVTLDYIPVQAGDPASGRAQAVDMAQPLAAA